MQTTRAPLVGLMGKKRSGKDTFADRLVAAHGFTRVAFADPLKEAALGLDPLIRVEVDEVGLFRGTDLYLGLLTRAHRETLLLRLSEAVDALGWEKAKELREVRRTLQRLGADSIRAIDPDFWLNAAKRAISRVDGPVVVTDVRFPNEADLVEARGTLVRITRPGIVGDDSHASETVLDDRAADWTIPNNGTLDDLYGYADALASQVTHR